MKKPDCAVLNITEEQPDIIRYPPPFEDRFNTLDAMGSTAGGIKLEQVWQPFWDTYHFDTKEFNGGIDIYFFQTSADRSRQDTNMQSAGQFSWPRRYYPRELTIRLGTLGAYGFVKEYRDSLNRAAEGLADNAEIELRIGERTEFVCPLWGMYNPKPREWKAPLLSSPYICPIQLFHVRLGIRGWSLPPRTAARCMMNGYLLREIN